MIHVKKNSNSKPSRQIIDSYDYLGNSASANDCTGLIPSAPQNRSELQSYEDIYAYSAPHIRPKTNKDEDLS